MTVCLELYHCHPGDLEPEQLPRLLSYVALYEIRAEEQDAKD
jgi:hypothetical protein